MRRLVIFSVLLFVGLFKASAQSSYYLQDERTFYGALIAGTNFTQIDGDNYAGYAKIGLNFGAAVYMFITPEFATSIEMLYAEKGSRSKNNDLRRIDGAIIEKFNVNLNYTEVPIQLHYFTKNKSHFGGGFALARIITSQQEIIANPLEDVYSEGFFKKFDFSIVLNSNIRLWKGLFLNTRFQYSLLNMAKKDIVNQSPVFGRTEQYNNVWTFRLMYLFGI